ncbi:hypothetical protein KUCAC02_033712, partial [Chaenocephalus aceratus]
MFWARGAPRRALLGAYMSCLKLSARLSTAALEKALEILFFTATSSIELFDNINPERT